MPLGHETAIMSWINKYTKDFLYDVISHSYPNYNDGLAQPVLKFSMDEYTAGICMDL